MSATLDFLLQKYGPSLTVDDLAEVLKRSPGGLRVTLSRRREPWADAIVRRCVHVGRRVYFPAEAIAELLAGGLVVGQGRSS